MSKLRILILTLVAGAVIAAATLLTTSSDREAGNHEAQYQNMVAEMQKALAAAKVPVADRSPQLLQGSRILAAHCAALKDLKFEGNSATRKAQAFLSAVTKHLQLQGWDVRKTGRKNSYLFGRDHEIISIVLMPAPPGSHAGYVFVQFYIQLDRPEAKRCMRQ
ncbi:RNA-binding protein [Streptomyces sp900105245]|uniref:RNA-binding protein n=1 Tax=Streptomyces sp. 900105245 TaxID=3154379 RepID=A0ABV1ULN6_9ACTN